MHVCAREVWRNEGKNTQPREGEYLVVSRGGLDFERLVFACIVVYACHPHSLTTILAILNLGGMDVGGVGLFVYTVPTHYLYTHESSP